MLNLAYLRFLWLHRRLDTGGLDEDDIKRLQLNLNYDEFDSVLATMEALLVLYRVPATESTNRLMFVVPARLPEYGDEQVLENGGVAPGSTLVRTRCLFRQIYAPLGLIPRFLAFSNARILEARECWQHGAYVIWGPGAHDVLVYETHYVEISGIEHVAYPALVLCVKGATPEVRNVLASLTREITRLFEDKVHGYPGLCPVVFEDTDVVDVSDVNRDLRQYLDNRTGQLSTTTRKVAEVLSRVIQDLYLPPAEENPYPRLLLLKPNTSSRSYNMVRSTPAQGSSQTVNEEGQHEVNATAIGEAMQRETWNKWIYAFRKRRDARMVFICEHDMTEVNCGPDGKGYVIRDLPHWLESCWPILQASLFAMRKAVETVSNVDLPLVDLLEAVVPAASSELLRGVGTSSPASGRTEAAALPDESTWETQHLPPDRLQEEAYGSLCAFMQGVESTSSWCCGVRSRCSTCGSTQRRDCVCIRWEDQMVRVSNGKGGLVWVKTTNEEAYKAKIVREVEASRESPRA